MCVKNSVHMGGKRGGGGAYMAGGACMVGEIATAADGTHPTGMRSCFLIFLLSSHKIYSP